MRNNRKTAEAMALSFASTIVRFSAAIDKRGPDECWLWKKAKNAKGYGYLQVCGCCLTTHRLAYIISKGPIPESLQIRHSCHNPACCNPAHLSVGTAQDNQDDKVAAGRQATGSRHGSKTHPERIARGDRHGSKTKPEKFKGGFKHAQ